MALPSPGAAELANHRWGLRVSSVAVSIACLLCTGCEACGRTGNDGWAALEDRAIAPIPGVRVAAPLGARQPRQVLLALTDSPGRCNEWLPSNTRNRFLVCVHGSAVDAASNARRALAALKKAYGSYVGPPPVTLVATEARATQGLELLFQEPAFFSQAVIMTARPSIDSIGLHSLGERGARTLVLVTPEGPDLVRLRATSRGSKLRFHHLQPEPEASKRALAWLESAWPSARAPETSTGGEGRQPPDR